MIACPQCGKLNPENFNYCLECGVELQQDAAHSAESQFFIDLSSKSPEVENARREAGKSKPNIPSPAPTTEKVVMPGEQGSPSPSAPSGTSEILELSPDDLIDDEGAEPGPPPAPPAEDLGEEVELEPLDLGEPVLLEEEVEDDEPEPPRRTEPPARPEAEPEPEFEPPVRAAEPAADESAPEIVLLEDVSEEPEKVQASPEPAPAAPVGGMSCPACGKPVAADDRFCGSCGATLGQEGGQKTMFLHAPDTEEPETPPFVGTLTVIEPMSGPGMCFNLLEGESPCGSQNGVVILDDKYVSPSHCLFRTVNGKMHVEDGESMNGLYVRLRGKMEIRTGDMFRIGHQLLRFVALSDFESVLDPVGPDETVLMGSPANKIWGKLLHISGKAEVTRQIPLNKPVLQVGREVGDITFTGDGFVSGQHARLAHEDGRFFLEDLNSSNGTYIRADEHTLNNNDLILIGQKLLRFEYA